MTAPDAASWIPLLVIVPLSGAGLAFLLPRLAPWIGLLTGACIAASSAGFVGEVLRHGVARYSLGGWGTPLGIELAADGLSAWLVSLAAVVGVGVSVHSMAYFGGGERDPHRGERLRERRYFWPLWMFLWSGLNAHFLSGDIFNLYVTLEMIGLASVGLVALANTRNALTAAMRYLLASLAGSLFYLLGVVFLYASYATLDLVKLAEAARPEPATWVALALMTGGLLMKGAVFPLHFWLPPAHSSAPAPVSALLSALVVKAPLYLLLRLWFWAFAPIGSGAFHLLLGLLGAGALVWGAANALRQSRLKLLVAYSTVAQLGYLLLVFPLVAGRENASTAWVGVLLFVAAHALAKTALFLAAGNVMHALGHDEIHRLGGLARALPKSTSAMALAGISLVGLPPSGGFMAKWLLLHSAIQQERWAWVVVMLTGTVLTIGYMVRLVGKSFAGNSGMPRAARLPALREWSALALAFLAAFMGLAVRWFPGLLGVGTPLPGELFGGGAP